METGGHKEFDKEVNTLFRKIKTDLLGLWPNAKDKNYADKERAQVVLAGLIAYDSSHNRDYISQFDKNYKLGESIDESTVKITRHALTQQVEYVPDDQDENEHLTRFRQIVNTVVLYNRQNILGININRDKGNQVARAFFIELYALRKLNDLYQGRNESVKVIEQMEWLGTQKELAELHITLQANGWIKKFYVNTIKAAYTKSDTIDQVMKRNESVRNGEQEYDQVYTLKYKPMFYGMKSNPKKD